jgi:hypothetical protein
MKARAFPALLLLLSAPLGAQNFIAQTYSSDIGFTYSLPADWEVTAIAPSLPVVQQQATKSATGEDEKKGVACVQIALTARHGRPPSVIVAVVLPFACFGQEMTEKDLSGVAEGASEALKKSFDISSPTYGAYLLGTHSVWIERVKGTLKGQPGNPYTVETVCSILKKGVVCWMEMAADDGALQTFEHGAIVLDGEAPTTLVPPTAFDKKPS